jgi:hypothetical protein
MLCSGVTAGQQILEFFGSPEQSKKPNSEQSHDKSYALYKRAVRRPFKTNGRLVAGGKLP